MRILVACERSGEVRRALRQVGHEAYSNDLVPADDGSPHHLLGDALEYARGSVWDAVLAFPPCTYLCRAGARWWAQRRAEQQHAIDFVVALWNLDCPRIAIENPIGKLSKVLGKPSQVIQPWEHGHGEVKSTCLWLKGLPLVTPTDIVEGRRPASWLAPDSKGRSERRSKTYSGIAQAMADQWFGQS